MVPFSDTASPGLWLVGCIYNHNPRNAGYNFAVRIVEKGLDFAQPAGRIDHRADENDFRIAAEGFKPGLELQFNGLAQSQFLADAQLDVGDKITAPGIDKVDQ